jgi:hypothetical protein
MMTAAAAVFFVAKTGANCEKKNGIRIFGVLGSLIFL